MYIFDPDVCDCRSVGSGSGAVLHSLQTPLKHDHTGVQRPHQQIRQTILPSPAQVHTLYILFTTPTACDGVCSRLEWFNVSSSIDIKITIESGVQKRLFNTSGFTLPDTSGLKTPSCWL